ncbi:MAG TPA: AAA family ATPase [Gemmatimonadales bacterium]|jgi:chromosome segregation protein|nr:AAA family ATPase [Gemmatimonadales bacterium]
MKLTRLELSGFKSFADTVTLTFEEGVTAIVGPNGCGKSNVSDAVRWVLGEQSARLLRGGKMEDVIFQGSTARRPVNVTEVSLYLDNSEGDLPIAYREVVVTRRLSRSGQSDYLLNGSPVRLRDIQDLLRGTGLGSDAGVVIEAKMIDLLLSDRADERRSLFEEAAGIGLYRDRKHSTERRLEETAVDLQRVEDLIAEVQSQIRSLARQRGKAERHGKLTEEKFSVQLTLARRQLDRLSEEAAGMEARFAQLTELLPAGRERLAQAEHRREEGARARGGAEANRTEIARRLSAIQVELGKLDGDLALAAERLANATARRLRAQEERSVMELRVQQALVERDAALADRDAASVEHQRIRQELTDRAHAEEEVRRRLGEQRNLVRQWEQELQTLAQSLRSLEGERAALEGELASLRERAAQAAAHRASLQVELANAQRQRDQGIERAGFLSHEAKRSAAEAERARHAVAEAREQEAMNRSHRRQAEEALAQMTARRHALEELERDRVGLAPAAAALLDARTRFDGGVLGPLSDFVSTGRDDAELTERLLGDWMHAVLVRDDAAVKAIQDWHAEQQPGALVLLPLDPGPQMASDGQPLDARLRVDGPALGWVRAALAGSVVLDTTGRVLRRASGAIFLSGAATPSGPLRRRAELASLALEVERGTSTVQATEATLQSTVERLAERERTLASVTAAAEQAREAERQAVAVREDAVRLVGNLTREADGSEAQLARVTERLTDCERRMAEIDAALVEGDLSRGRLDEALGAGRTRLADLETEQELAREQRAHWQVQEAHVGGGLRSAEERLQRAAAAGTEADNAVLRLSGELSQLEADSGALASQQAAWRESRAERQLAFQEVETATAAAETDLTRADAALAAAERNVTAARSTLESVQEESHRLQVQLTEASGARRSIVERIEAEWHRPLDQLLDGAALLDLDLETLETEAARILGALEGIGPVNALAVEEHAEEVKRLEFLTSQRDDLVGARQSLIQAIREIDGTARSMFLETFTAVQANFTTVFQTLFGGGECELLLANPADPLESEIDIHAAPRGKRTQRIHLLSSGERTLVAVSLLFSIYLTKPSPFCLMDEVDAPLDDANVGRFTRLLDEFKAGTQFLVITHNPRTMQAADAVYGVTMQEPGVSTIVGVRLGEAEHVA